MGETRRPKPTEAELAILRVLWGLGSGTVRQVHDGLPDRGTGYTTTLKLLQIMTTKGLVRRDESKRSHVYRPAASREQTQRRLLGELLETVFGGSRRTLVMQLLAGRRSSPQELAEIRAMIDAAERDKP